MGGRKKTMSEKEHIWIPKLKQQLADKKIDRREFVRYCDAARHVVRRRLYVGRQDHRRADSPRRRWRRICRRAACSRSPAGAQGRQSAHLLVGLRLEHRAPGLRLSHPHRRRQRHPSASVRRSGRPREDLKTWTLHHGGRQVAQGRATSPPSMPPGTSSTASIPRSARRSSA